MDEQNTRFEENLGILKEFGNVREQLAKLNSHLPEIRRNLNATEEKIGHYDKRAEEIKDSINEQNSKLKEHSEASVKRIHDYVAKKEREIEEKTKKLNAQSDILDGKIKEFMTVKESAEKLLESLETVEDRIAAISEKLGIIEEKLGEEEEEYEDEEFEEIVVPDDGFDEADTPLTATENPKPDDAPEISSTMP